MNKSDLRAAILHHLEGGLALQIRAAQLARDEAISEESRAESKYDTHSQEAAYLAEGQARLAGEIEGSLSLYAGLPLPDFPPGAAIGLGALVEVRSAEGPIHWYFLGPGAGGVEISLGGRSVLVLTPQSPLGRALLGKHAGEAIGGPGRAGRLEILSVL